MGKKVKKIVMQLNFGVIVYFNTATPNSTNFASKLFYYVFFKL